MGKVRSQRVAPVLAVVLGLLTLGASLAAFTARLRQSVDFDTVQGDLVNTVHEAFQPAHIPLWFTPGTSAEPRGVSR